MKIYLASRFEAQKQLREVRKRIHEGSDHLVISRWIDSSPDRPPYTDGKEWEEYSKRCGVLDLLDLSNADWAIFDLTLDMSGCKGGVYVEMGYCLATNKSIAIVGRRTNVFCYDSRIRHFKDWETFFAQWGINVSGVKTGTGE